MARLTGEFKRGALRSLYRSTQGSSTQPATEGSPPTVMSLQVALDAFQDASFAQVQSGKITTQAAGTGRTVQFAVPQVWMTLTQEEVFCLSEELEQVCADAKANLVAQGNTTPDDATIFAAMMSDDRLATITDVRKDYTGLRFPNRWA